MRILITGAAGFLGEAICNRLLKDGHRLIAIVRQKRPENAISMDIVEADLAATGSLLNSVKFAPEVVLHLAAVSPPSFLGPDAARAAEVNRTIDKQVFHACQQWGCGVIYASSSSVYGLEGDSIHSENSPLSPIGPYAQGKAESEALGQDILNRAGSWMTTLRISAPYGPGQRARTVLQTFLKSAINGQAIFYDGSGNRQQDFTYVLDIVDALVQAIRIKNSGAYNIASGRPVSMVKLAELAVQSVPGCKSVIRSSGRSDPQEQFKALFDTQKAAKDLGWTAKVPLREGLSKVFSAVRSIS